MSSRSQSKYVAPQVLVIGLGYHFRRDDAAGCLVAQLLEVRKLPDTEVIEQNGGSPVAMDMWQHAGVVIVIDAVSSGAQPGTIHRFDAIAQKLPSNLFHYSSHSLGLIESVELARIFNRLPPRFIVYGIEGEDFSAGEGLTMKVERACREIADTISSEIRQRESRLVKEKPDA